MPQSKKRKDKRGKPVKHTPRWPAFTLASALDLQAYFPDLTSLVEQAQAAFRALPPCQPIGSVIRSGAKKRPRPTEA